VVFTVVSLSTITRDRRGTWKCHLLETHAGARDEQFGKRSHAFLRFTRILYIIRRARDQLTERHAAVARQTSRDANSHIVVYRRGMLPLNTRHPSGTMIAYHSINNKCNRSMCVIRDDRNRGSGKTTAVYIWI